MIIISEFGSMFRRASMDLMGDGGTVPECGAIFMSNRKTMEECLRRKLFGLPFSKTGFVKHVKVGMVLFLFEYERRELHGVFQASTDGAIDIVPEAFCSSGKQFSAQVRITTIWNCTPLTEHEFSDAIRDNYFAANKFNFGLSKDQVHRLLLLFSSKKLKDLQPQRQLRRSSVSKPVRSSLGKVQRVDATAFITGHREENVHGVNNDLWPAILTEYPGNSLGKISRLPDEASFAVSDQGERQRALERDIGLFISTVKDEVIKIPDSGRFTTSDRVGNDRITAEYQEKSLGKERRASYDGRYPTSDWVEKDYNVDPDIAQGCIRSPLKQPNDLKPILTTERREKSLGKERTAYVGRHSTSECLGNSLGEVRRGPDPERFMTSDMIGNEGHVSNDLGPAISTEIPVNPMGDARRVVDDNRFMVSNRVRNRLQVDDDPRVAFPTEYYGNSLGEVRRVTNVHRFATSDWVGNERQMDNNIEPAISTEYLYKPNLNRLDYSGKQIKGTDNSSAQPYFESSAFCLREQRTSCEDTIATSTDPYRSGTPTIHYSGLPSCGLYHSSNSVQECPHCSSLGNAFCSPKNESPPFHAESRGVTRCLDITSGFGNCVSSPTPDDYERSCYRTTMPFSGPGYSESKAVEFSDLEGYRGSSFAESSLLPVPLLKGENDGPAPYSFRSIEETPYDYGYPEASHNKNKLLPKGGDGEAYAANVPLSNEVQYHSRGDLCSLEAKSLNFHENNMSDHDVQSRKKIRGMYSARQKSRNSVFSRLTFAAELCAEDNDSPVDYNEHNVDTSVNELMDMLHDSSYHWAKKLRKSKPLIGHHDNGENIRNKKLKTVYSGMERDQCTLLPIQKNMDDTLGNGESDHERTKGKSAVHFKRRSETRKNRDEIKTGGFVGSTGSNGLLGAHQKRRKLVRPNFSKNEHSHEKDIIGENTPNLQLSSQESSFSKDNTGSCEASDRNHENKNKVGQQAGLLHAPCQAGCEAISTEARSGSDSKGGRKEESGSGLSLKNEGENGKEGSKIEEVNLLVTCRDEPIAEESMVHRLSQDHVTESCSNVQESSLNICEENAGSVTGLESA
ncbi:hypothetical protein PVL29_000167 [Vitis rotundifolia]|uniref:DCD domain-containing protein n=1 Tax=Vitis rotundifolia TaxID=103349 RepID=A0AA39AI70_VITRO|nr:hypothetical protein PVL29_000167 [Vitis rotundifolia]